MLGVATPGGDWFGIPARDTLVVYGRAEAVRALQQRRKGAAADREHAAAVGRQDRIAAGEREAQGER